MPTPPRWDEIDAALDRALEASGAERDAVLDGLAPTLREAVEGRLRDALRDDPLLDHPEAALAGLAAITDWARGQRVGPYRIDALIGEGGMGRVFRARRADGAYDQTVAIKVVRQSLALAGADVAARLRRERAVLATLGHPGIARLLDGGETDDGVPYLVTEFVDGAPITAWADTHQLSVPARVGLVVEAARSVDHAHRRFVVHRDLKPSNVLVTDRDGVAHAVVLDFGIAKLLDAADDASDLTQTGKPLLTPAYAAPELYDADAPVTAAVDVYGLGAVLYELLTGERPHDGRPISGRHGTEPERPSQRVVAGARGAAARARALQGDLDTICLKALHPDPSRRYASAADLADDLERYLGGRPVQARPDGWGYIAGRFARRHRAAVAAAAVAMIALVSALAITVVSLGSERAARADAEAAAARATEAAGMLSGLFGLANPEQMPGRAVTAREALDGGVRRVAGVEDVGLRAYLYGVLGETYSGIGEVVEADYLFDRALALAEQDGRMTQARLSWLRLGLADTRSRLRDPEAALALFERVRDDHSMSDSLGLRARRELLSLVAEERGVAEAERMARAFVQDARKVDNPDALPQILYGQMQMLVWAAEKPAEGIPVAKRTLALHDSLYGPDRRSTRIARSTLAQAYAQAGRYAEAVELHRHVLASHVRVHGPGSRDQGYQHVVLGQAMEKAGDYASARDEIQVGIAMAATYIGDEHPDVGWWLLTLADVCRRLGDDRAAEDVARRAIRIGESIPSDPLTARAVGQLGLALAGQARMGKADPFEAQATLGQAARMLEAPAELPESYVLAAAETLREVRAAQEGFATRALARRTRLQLDR